MTSSANPSNDECAVFKEVAHQRQEVLDQLTARGADSRQQLDADLQQIDARIQELSAAPGDHREELATLSKQRSTKLGSWRSTETKSGKQIRTVARELLHAEILLRTHGSDWDAEEIADALGIESELVTTVRQRYDVRGLDAALGPVLTAGERERADDWYRKYAANVVGEVRKQLRVIATARSSVSMSDIAQSVWQSFLDNHKGEVDLDDPNSVWGLLAKGVQRHCEKWNRYATRHPNVTLSGLRTADGDDAGSYDPADASSFAPEVEIMLNTCLDVLGMLENTGTSSEGSVDSAPLLELDGTEELTRVELEVLALRIRGATLKEISSLLRKDYTQILKVWNAIMSKLQQLAD